MKFEVLGVRDARHVKRDIRGEGRCGECKNMEKGNRRRSRKGGAGGARAGKG